MSHGDVWLAQIGICGEQRRRKTREVLPFLVGRRERLIFKDRTMPDKLSQAPRRRRNWRRRGLTATSSEALRAGGTRCPTACRCAATTAVGRLRAAAAVRRPALAIRLLSLGGRPRRKSWSTPNRSAWPCKRPGGFNGSSVARTANSHRRPAARRRVGHSHSIVAGGLELMS